MTDKKPSTPKSEPKGKPWNFPQEGITIFAETREDALKELESLQKKASNPKKS